MHPVEAFDNDTLRLLSSALDAAVSTIRLTGVEVDDGLKFSMARGVVAAAAEGDEPRLNLISAALMSVWHPTRHRKCSPHRRAIRDLPR